MARYIERAENVARILDVNLQLFLEFANQADDDRHDRWLPIVRATGDLEVFSAHHPRATAASVAEFMVFQQENPNSIVASVCQARENARIVRDQITMETWEELNHLYLFVLSPQARLMWLDSPTDFFNQVKTSSQLLGGLSDATHLRNEGWWFNLAGRFIERADKTSRILDVHGQALPATGQPVRLSQADALAWVAVLRSCSAWDAFKSQYGADVQPRHVAEMLMLNENFPRSIRFCVERLDEALRHISGVSDRHFSNEAERLCGRLAAELRFTTIQEIFVSGVHGQLDEIQVHLNHIGDALFQTYIFRAFETGLEAHRVQQEEQQQQSIDGRRSDFLRRRCFVHRP
jgi:uncharacterized alpha-E superfamily protein